MKAHIAVNESQRQSRLGIWQRYVPGLLLVLFLAVAAKILGQVVTWVPDVVVALVAGIVVGNLLLRDRNKYREGVRFAQTTLLQTAIVLLGGSLSFAAVLRIGVQTVGVILLCFVLAFSLSVLFARVLSLPGKVGVLLGSGTAICGATAIITIGPLINADEEEIAYAVTTIFFFNILAVVIYPALGHMFNLSSLAFGTWAGTSVNDTSAVIASSYAYSPGAGAVATVVKLTRTLLLVPLSVGVSSFAARHPGQRVAVLKTTPWFVFGFAVMAVLNSFGLLAGDLPRVFAALAGFLIVMVLAAVGLNVEAVRMRAMGPVPFLAGILLAVVMSALSFGIVRFLDLA